MEFIKTMKKREFIEMGLKTAAAILAAFFAIILMEGMIYSINLNALKTNGSGYTINANSSVAYCIKDTDDKYYVIYYNEDSSQEWASSKSERFTEAECKALENTKVSKVIMHAPNAFEFSITPVHYVVMAVFVAGVAGFFVYKFISLANQYKKIEEDFEKTGTISL